MNHDTYYNELGGYVPLSDAEERALAQRIEQGDGEAINRLVTANLRFVLHIAKEYAGKGVDFDDLVSEGNIGLMAAAARYSTRRDRRFVQFAAPYIRQAMERAIGDGQQPMSIDAPIPEGSQNTISLLHVLENPNAEQTDAHADRATLSVELQQHIGVLNEREQEVVRHYFGIGTDALTMAEIGNKMGLKRERVRQIRKKALRKLTLRSAAAD